MGEGMGTVVRCVEYPMRDVEALEMRGWTLRFLWV